MSIFDHLLTEAPEPITTTIKGVELSFQAPHGFDEFAALEARCRQLAKVWTTPALMTGDMKGLHLVSEEAAFACALLAECSVEPKLTHKDALRLCKYGAHAFALLVTEVVIPIRHFAVRQEAEAIDSEKKGCAETPCEDCSCEHRENAGVGTPTS